MSARTRAASASAPLCRSDTSGVFAVLIPSHEFRHNGADADAARVRALIAYKDFLTLWKNADPDIPILRQAKAEYARLQ